MAARILPSLPVLAATFVIAAFGGCATAPRPEPARPTAARMIEDSRSAARTWETRLGLAVAAADMASKTMTAEDGDKSRAIYNQACVEVATLSKKVTLPVTLKTPVGAYRLSAESARSTGVWAPAYCDELIPLNKIRNQTLVSKVPPSGFGGVMVGVRRPPDPRSLLLPRVGVSFPVTAVVSTRPSTGGVTQATLTLYDPSVRESVRLLGSNRTLAADLPASFGYYPVPPKVGLLGMLRPQRFLNQEGLFLTQPYDPKKIPLLLIHGLMSDPSMWLPVMAAVESDPALRGKFQMWVFAYPTGNPIGYSALELREALSQVYKVYPKTKDMVIVNHSLGGVITHLQAIDSGDALVKGIFKKRAPQILALPEDSPVKKALIFRANPRIARVVFVAAPHRGAPLASNWIGDFGANLIRVPGRVVSDIGTATIQAATAAAGIRTTFVPNSINGLSAANPLLIAMNSVPIRVPFHSIIGVAGKPKVPLEKTSDTVVPYWSSHLDGALSEKIVPYPHTAMFVKTEATDEIRRILRLHLAAPGNRR